MAIMRIFDMAPSRAKPYRVTLDDAESKRKFPALANADHLTMGQPLRVEAETRIERIQLVAANVACGSFAAISGRRALVRSYLQKADIGLHRMPPFEVTFFVVATSNPFS
jgi:hypothetical protein